MPKRKKLDDTDVVNVANNLTRTKPPPCKYFLSTGSTLLDLAVSDRYPGGVGSGRVVQIIGDNSTAKTVVAKEILGAAQRHGGYAIEEDAEYTPDFERSWLFGLNVGKWGEDDPQDANVDVYLQEAAKVDDHYCYRNPQSIEEIFDDDIGPAEMLTEGLLPDGVNEKTGVIKTKPAGFELPKPLVISVDTFTALPSLKEERRRLDEDSYNMERAKSMSGGFRKWLKHLGRTDTTVIAVDHIRSAVGVSFGPQWTTSGGKAMQQYASTRIFLAHAGAIKNKDDVKIGIWVRAKCVKNKIAPPFREVKFAVLFDYGIDDIRSNVEWLKEQKVDSKLSLKGAWYAWGDERLGNGLENAIIFIEKNGMEREIEEEVIRVWREVYRPPDRKVKER